MTQAAPADPLAVAPSAGWQPIETAPGRISVLVCRKGTDCIAIARHVAKGWVHGKAHTRRLWFPPTHWMPFPRPPASTPSVGDPA